MNKVILLMSLSLWCASCTEKPQVTEIHKPFNDDTNTTISTNVPNQMIDGHPALGSPATPILRTVPEYCIPRIDNPGVSMTAIIPKPIGYTKPKNIISWKAFFNEFEKTQAYKEKVIEGKNPTDNHLRDDINFFTLDDGNGISALSQLDTKNISKVIYNFVSISNLRAGNENNIKPDERKNLIEIFNIFTKDDQASEKILDDLYIQYSADLKKLNPHQAHDETIFVKVYYKNLIFKMYGMDKVDLTHPECSESYISEIDVC